MDVRVPLAVKKSRRKYIVYNVPLGLEAAGKSVKEAVFAFQRKFNEAFLYESFRKRWAEAEQANKHLYSYIPTAASRHMYGNSI